MTHPLADPRLHNMIRVLARRRIRMWRDAADILEDIVQSTLCDAVRSWHTYDPAKGSLNTWVKWIMLHVVTLEKQRRKARKRSDFTVLSECELHDHDSIRQSPLEVVGQLARQEDIVYAKEIWRAHEKVAAHKCNQTQARKRRTEEFEKVVLLGHHPADLARDYGLSRAIVDLDIKQHRKELVQHLERRQ